MYFYRTRNMNFTHKTRMNRPNERRAQVDEEAKTLVAFPKTGELVSDLINEPRVRRDDGFSPLLVLKRYLK